MQRYNEAEIKSMEKLMVKYIISSFFRSVRPE